MLIFHVNSIGHSRVISKHTSCVQAAHVYLIPTALCTPRPPRYTILVATLTMPAYVIQSLNNRLCTYWWRSRRPQQTSFTKATQLRCVARFRGPAVIKKQAPNIYRDYNSKDDRKLGGDKSNCLKRAMCRSIIKREFCFLFKSSC